MYVSAVYGVIPRPRPPCVHIPRTFDPTHQDEHCFMDRYGGRADVVCGIAEIDLAQVVGAASGAVNAGPRQLIVEPVIATLFVFTPGRL